MCCPDPRPCVSSRTCQCHRFLLIWWSIHYPNNQPATVCLACMKSELHKNQCVKSLYQHIRNPKVCAGGSRILDRLKLTNWHVPWWWQWWGVAPCQRFGKQPAKKETNDCCRGGRMMHLDYWEDIWMMFWWLMFQKRLEISREISSSGRAQLSPRNSWVKMSG